PPDSRREPGIGDKAPWWVRAWPVNAAPGPLPPSPLVLTFAPWGAAPDRPAGPPSRRRCPLEPRPRGARARATTLAPLLPLPSPLVLTFAPRGAALDRPTGRPPPGLRCEPGMRGMVP